MVPVSGQSCRLRRGWRTRSDSRDDAGPRPKRQGAAGGGYSAKYMPMVSGSTRILSKQCARVPDDRSPPDRFAELLVCLRQGVVAGLEAGSGEPWDVRTEGPERWVEFPLHMADPPIPVACQGCVVDGERPRECVEDNGPPCPLEARVSLWPRAMLHRPDCLLAVPRRSLFRPGR